MIKNILSDLLIVVGILLIIIGLFTFNLEEDNIKNRINYLMNYVPGNTPVDYINDDNFASVSQNLDLNYDKLNLSETIKNENNYSKNNSSEKLDFANNNSGNYKLSESLNSTEFDWEKAIFSKKDVLVNSNKDFDLLNKNENENKEKEKVEVVIKSGFSGNKIADILSEKGVINRDDFIRALIIFNAERKLNSGVYTFEKNADLLDVFSKILAREVN